ncbi:uncharacterized protein BDW70DRAFT_124095 [Aspergillus foveolatus]|uniref:uncharacterized protein n=1 Tax=Aspergillus foveolatus TaxID=210207 RepID=UPI003CCE334A
MNAGIGPSEALLQLLSLIQALCRAYREHSESRTLAAPFLLGLLLRLLVSLSQRCAKNILRYPVRLEDVCPNELSKHIKGLTPSPRGDVESDTLAHRPGPRSNLSADPSMYVCRLHGHIHTVDVTQSIILGIFQDQPASLGGSMGNLPKRSICLTFVQTFAGNTLITERYYRNARCVSLRNHMTKAPAAAGPDHNAESYRVNPYRYYPATSKPG